MSDWVRGAFCPRCGHLLYTVTRKDSSPGWTQHGPSVQLDGNGCYILCGSCRARVPLKPTTELPGWGYEVRR
jgi:hypothetical protein